MKEYNGHRSWNAWNTSLWLNNDEALEYRMRGFKSKNEARRNLKYLVGEKTPDGALINTMAINAFINERFE